jgi:hypothetical protein
MEHIVTGEVEPPSRLVRDYPRPLEDIVMKLLARSPQQRYQNAHALLEDLETFVTKRGMLTSAYVVAKYMRELFGKAANAKPDRDTVTDWGPLVNTIESQVDSPEDEPTAAFRRAEQLWTTELKVKIRTPRRAAPERERERKSDLSIGDESSPGFHEHTRQDPVLPFDPIDARSEELLAYLDSDAPPREMPQARAYRRVDTLLHRALAYVGLGELDKAVTAVELALDEEPRTSEVHDLLQQHVDTIVSVYETMLEGPYRTPALTRPLAELAHVELEERGRWLLPLIDGKTTIKDLITRCGLQRLEVYHHLCQFLMRGIIR